MPKPNVKLAQDLGGIIGAIVAFDRKCKAAEYTDTGEVWDLLRALKKAAQRALKASRKAAA